MRKKKLKELESTALADECNDDEPKYVLSEWGCLCSVLKDYGIDTRRVPGKIGQHIVDDFMDLMCKMGYVQPKEDYADGQQG